MPLPITGNILKKNITLPGNSRRIKIDFMKWLFKWGFILLIGCRLVAGQATTFLMKGTQDDSSFYSIKKISDNEYWAGGQNGLLKRIDSSGNVSSINFPNDGSDILKIEQVNNYVYLVTSNAVIYKYDMVKKVFTRKQFSAFRNKCFYDMILLKNGGLLVCGGAKRIEKGKRVIPRGFIAYINPEADSIKLIWSCYRKFVWSLCNDSAGGIMASAYNGFNSEIIKTENLISWNKMTRIKGLVYSIYPVGSQLYYCGSKTINYREDGIFGFVSNSFRQNIVKKSGCIWRMLSAHGKILAITNSRELLDINGENSISGKFSMPVTGTMYCIEKITESKLLIAGHGKELLMVKLND
jgi:hypothetical protein